jgi:dTDP-4-amino-4,6-dideoxygalactose transaminase
VLPPAPADGGDHFDTFQNYEIEAERRDDLRAFLKKEGVGTIIQWGGKLVHQFPALGLSADVPRTEALFSRSLQLPMNSSLTPDEVDFVGDCIHRFYRGS